MHAQMETYGTTVDQLAVLFQNLAEQFRRDSTRIRTLGVGANPRVPSVSERRNGVGCVLAT
jgi:hypothetical protein